MPRPRCAAPLSPGILSDYWLGALSPEVEEPIEEHLLGCGECARSLQWVIDLAGATRALARRGLLRVVVSVKFLDRLANEGLHLRQYRVTPGGSVACTVTPEDDLMVVRLAAPFEAPARADLVFCGQGGEEEGRLPDVAAEFPRGEVVFTVPIDEIRRLGPGTSRIQIVAVEVSGERVLGEYTFNHTPYSPG